MLEPLGESQVVAYLELLAVEYTIHLISFEKAEDWAKQSERQALCARIGAAGIQWHPLRYHKWPSAIATAWDIACGTLLGLWLTLVHRVSILHARSYVASMMAFFIKRLTGVRYVFDMRGFWADERVDGGLWPAGGRLYKLAKRFERRFLLNADHVVTLTHAAVRIIQGFSYLQSRSPPFTVIPTCADLKRFKPAPKVYGPNPFVLGYVGTVGTWYLFDHVAATVATLLRLRPDAQFLVVNRGEHSHIRDRLQAAGVPMSAVQITSATHAEVPTLMSRMHAGIFFIKPAYSKQGSAPTKLAEFLGCGIPCLGNSGVGDMAEILHKDRVGVALERLNDRSIAKGLQDLFELVADPTTMHRCVESARKHFSLEDGVAKYRDIYEALK